MKFQTLSLALLLGTLGTTSVVADELRTELTPFVGYRFGGTFDIEGSSDSYRLDDSEAFGLVLNLRNDDNTQWEIFYSQQSTTARLEGTTGVSPEVDTDLYTLQLGGTYQGDGDTVRPYVAMTLGGTHIKTLANSSQSDTFFSGSIGLGLNISPSNRVGLRLEARAYGTLTDSSTDLFCRTGPDANVCAIRVDGNLMSQVETFAGIVFRF